MGNVLFYTHNKEDLKRIVKMVVDEIRKTEQINDSAINLKDDRLSQREAAAFLGTSITSLISWKKQGKVPYYQIGRSIFFSKSELLKLARQNREAIGSNRR